jgi:hypothetical protein
VAESADSSPATKAAPSGGLFVWGVPLLVLDSITEAIANGMGCVVVTGSHGGLSAGRFALQGQVLMAVFNDAGVGLDQAGIAALALMQAQGLAACTVAHSSARIGDAQSTLHTGLISHANAQALLRGARPGMLLRDVLLSAP